MEREVLGAVELEVAVPRDDGNRRGERTVVPPGTVDGREKTKLSTKARPWDRTRQGGGRGDTLTSQSPKIHASDARAAYGGRVEHK